MSDRQPTSTLQAAANHPSAVRGWLFAFCAAFVLYALTSNRHIQWQDSGYHILRVVTGELVNPNGLAMSHPLHQWLARALVFMLPWEPAFSVTLLSAIAAAIAVANVYGCVLLLTGHRYAAGWAAASLAVANVFWHLGTTAETYTLVAAILSAECWCLAAFVRTPGWRLLAGLAFLNGLGISNHMFAALTTPVVVCVILVVMRKHWIVCLGVGLGCWLMGASPYLYLIGELGWQTGDWGGALHSALFGKSFADAVLNATPSMHRLVVSIAFIVLSFPSLLIPVSVAGMTRRGGGSIAPITRCALLAGLAVHLLFAARYNVVDQFMFFCPAYVLLALFGGVAAARYAGDNKSRKGVVLAWVMLLITPVVSGVAPSVARRVSWLQSSVQNKPYRDDFVYLLTPWSVVENSAERMSRRAVALAGERGLILIEDGMARFAVQYRVVLEGLEGLEISTEISLEQITHAARSGRTVVLVPMDRDEPQTEAPVGSWRREGDIYVLDYEASSG